MRICKTGNEKSNFVLLNLAYNFIRNKMLGQKYQLIIWLKAFSIQLKRNFFEKIQKINFPTFDIY